MSQKEGLLSPFLYEDSDDDSKENKFEKLKQLETMIITELAIMEQYSSKYFPNIVNKIQGFYDLLEGQINSVSGKALAVILDIHLQMHTTLTRMIKKKTINNLREVTRSSRAGKVENREDARVLAQGQHPFISETSGESSGESKFDDNVYMLDAMKKLSPSMQKAAELDLKILKQINFLDAHLLLMLRKKQDVDEDVIKYYTSMAEVTKKLIAKFSILGLDISLFQGTAILVPTRLRF